MDTGAWMLRVQIFHDLEMTQKWQSPSDRTWKGGERGYLCHWPRQQTNVHLSNKVLKAYNVSLAD